MILMAVKRSCWTARARAVMTTAAAVAVYAVAVRPRLRHWGATHREVAEPLPGDQVVRARWHTTRGVDIAAPAASVWPWLVQMGYGRAGWYSFDAIERIGGFGDFADGGSARRIIPELQSLALGDTVALSPTNGLTVAVIDPPRALVLHLRMSVLTGAVAVDGDKAVLDWTWAFVLRPTSSGTCRLLVRVRADYHPRALSLTIPVLLEPIHLLMELRMLRTIRLRAEAANDSGDFRP
jgi:hypothetical protein